jgi:hypothetical protein
MLVGGLIGKPKYFWLVSLILGVLFIGTFSPFIHDTINRIHYSKPIDIDIEDILIIIFCVIPGLTVAIMGILLRIKEKDNHTLSS